MKRKKFLKVILCIIILIVLMKYYTDYLYNKAVNDCKNKYNNLQTEKLKVDLNSSLNFKERLLDKFDEKLYDSIIKISNYENVLIYSLIVSNKWNYSEASFNVFRTLVELDKKNTSTNLPEIDFLDEESRKMALHYLEKASNSENPNAKYILGKYYVEGKYLKKNIEKGKSLLNEAKRLSGGILE